MSPCTAPPPMSPKPWPRFHGRSRRSARWRWPPATLWVGRRVWDIPQHLSDTQLPPEILPAAPPHLRQTALGGNLPDPLPRQPFTQATCRNTYQTFSDICPHPLHCSLSPVERPVDTPPACPTARTHTAVPGFQPGPHPSLYSTTAFKHLDKPGGVSHGYLASVSSGAHRGTRASPDAYPTSGPRFASVRNRFAPPVESLVPPTLPRPQEDA